MIWLITLLGLILRLVNINQSLWLDEASETSLSQMPLHDIFFGRLGDVHPPLSFIFYHFWLLVSHNDSWIRLLPVLFGVATIPLVYKLTKDLLGKSTAVWAAIFMAVAPFHIYYSQEIRMYSMAAFFATLSMFCLVNLNKKFYKLGYVLSTAALIYTHHIGFLVLGSQIIYLLWRKEIKKVGWSLLSIVFWLPWLPVFLAQLKNGASPDQYLPGWSRVLSLPLLKALPVTFVKFSIGRISFENRYIYGLVIALVSVVFIPLILWGVRKLNRGNYLLLFWLIGPVLLSLIVSFRLPIYETQRMIVVLPAFYILMANGTSNLKKFKSLAIATILLISIGGLMVYWTNPKFEREDWKGAVNFISDCQMSCDVLFVWPQPFDPYIWYGGKSGVGLVKKFPATREELTVNIDQNKKEHILFEYLQPLTDPTHQTQQVLTSEGYLLKETVNFNGVGFVDLYQKQ